MWSYPLAGVFTATILLGSFLLVEGIFEIILAFQLRPVMNWIWVLIDGMITLVLGGIVWSQSPASAPWLLGTFVGISILFSGISRLMLAIALRSSLHQTR